MAHALIVSHLGITIELLRKIVSLVQDTVVRFDREDGGVCPTCRSPRARICCTRLPFRSHRCRNCGTRFQSIEHPSGKVV